LFNEGKNTFEKKKLTSFSFFFIASFYSLNFFCSIADSILPTHTKEHLWMMMVFLVFGENVSFFF
jgi:hypothetical protein